MVGKWGDKLTPPRLAKFYRGGWRGGPHQVVKVTWQGRHTATITPASNNSIQLMGNQWLREGTFREVHINCVELLPLKETRT
jgi:hypothetical protein